MRARYICLCPEILVHLTLEFLIEVIKGEITQGID